MTLLDDFEWGYGAYAHAIREAQRVTGDIAMHGGPVT